MAEWNGILDGSNMPEWNDLVSYTDNPLWEQLCSFIEQTFGVQPVMEYSACSLQPGWNVKYKKTSKSICTLYPVKGCFLCLVVVSGKQADEAELLLTACTPYVQTLYREAKPYNGGRWLMAEVRDEHILNDLEELMLLRVPPKKPAKT